MAEPSTYQSLYRRYRSQRFDQVLGQDHITTALRNAVRDGRVGHAYLFSGPRGTGKTSTARILAKVLNCSAPDGGEPCGQCDNCLAVERGQDIDWLLEQDAASKSKVDDMRDLLDRVPLGTSGNRKVIILDEVHMLSQGAENALLKTLEEPPAHVVFVLATTDPQKVRPTIRSRAQHFEFHLLNADVIADHVRYVIGDADLGFGDDQVATVVDHVVQAGGGSARDTLSALDQVAALGDVVVDSQPVRAILDAVAARDTGGVLVAVAEAVSTGREPRMLGDALIASLRDAFLSVMGAVDDRLTPTEKERAKELGEAMGPARLTRALEVLGEALTELARKPDPRIVVEVALVRIAQPNADTSLQALAARVQELERSLDSGEVTTAAVAPLPAAAPQPPAAQPGVAQPAAPQPAQPTAPQPQPQPQPASGGPANAARAVLAQERQSQVPDTPSGEATVPSQAQGGRPTLGALARDAGSAPGGPDQPPSSPPSPPEQAGSAPVPETPEVPAAPLPEASSTPGTQSTPPATEGAAAPAPPDLPKLEQLVSAWDGSLLGALPIPVRSKWRGGRWVDVAGGTAKFSVPNEWHKKACDEGRRDVEQAFAEHFGVTVPVEVIVDGGGVSDAAGSAGAGSAAAGGAAASHAEGSSGAGPEASASAGGSGSAPVANMATGEPPLDGSSWSGGPVAHGSLAVSDDPDDEAEVDVAEIAGLADADDIATGGVELLMKAFGGGLVTSENPPI